MYWKFVKWELTPYLAEEQVKQLVNMAAHPVYGFDKACLEP